MIRVERRIDVTALPEERERKVKVRKEEEEERGGRRRSILFCYMLKNCLYIYFDRLFDIYY